MPSSLPLPVKAVGLVAIILSLSFAVVSASPAPLDKTSVIFRRACAECDAAEFCEYGYPGGPMDSVACITYDRAGTRSELYRRYADAPNGACTDASITGSYPTSKLCASGSGQWAACDMATGLAPASGAASASGVCVAGSAVCCMPASVLQGTCGTEKLCTSGADAALYTAATAGQPIYCNASTGAVTGGNTGSAICDGALGTTAGSIAGCCTAFS